MKKFLVRKNNYESKKFFKMTSDSHSFCMSKFISCIALIIVFSIGLLSNDIKAFDKNIFNTSKNSEELNLNPKSMDGYFSSYFNVSNISNYEYTARDIKPYVNVYYNNPNYINELLFSDYGDYSDRNIGPDKGILLRRNIDYKVDYLGDRNGSLKNSGTHYIKITGIGEFSGVKLISFSVLPHTIDLNKLTARDENNVDYYYINKDNNNLVSKERDGNASCLNDANSINLYYKNNNDEILFEYDDAKFTKISAAKNNERVDAYIANCDIKNYNTLLDVSFKNVRLSNDNDKKLLENYIVKEDKNISDGYNSIVSKIGIIKDTSLPTLTKITSNNNTFRYGQEIEINLYSDEEIKVNSGYIKLYITAKNKPGEKNKLASKQIALKLDAKDDYSYSKVKTFKYRVQRNDMALSNIEVVKLDLSKGSLTDLYQHELKVPQEVIDEYNKTNTTYIDNEGFNVTVQAHDTEDKTIDDFGSSVSMNIIYSVTFSENADRDLTRDDIILNYGEITGIKKLTLNRYEVTVNICDLLEEELKDTDNMNLNSKELIFEIRPHRFNSMRTNKKNIGKVFTIKIKDENIDQDKEEMIEEINTYIDEKNKSSNKFDMTKLQIIKMTFVKVGMIVSNYLFY